MTKYRIAHILTMSVEWVAPFGAQKKRVQMIFSFFPAKKTKVYFLSPDLVKTLKISICLKFSVVLILSRRRRPVGSRDKCKQLSIVKRVAFCSLLVQLLAPLKSVWDCQDRDDLHQVLLCVKFQFGQ